MTLLEAALGYVARGWFVHPLKPRSKEPATAHGVLDASNDPMQVAAWWMENPEYNIGIATGPSDLVVIDIDPRNGGLEGWKQVSPTGTMLDTATGLTGGDGYHFYLSGAGKYRSPIAPGVDVKSEGGYVVAPPSVHPDGKVYLWAMHGEEAKTIPDWLLPLLTKPEREPSAPVEYDPNDDRPGSIYIRSTNWPDLMTGWGWQPAGVGVSGQQFWTRPGKDEGISAVTGGETDTLFVWSTSTPFEAGKPYNRFGAYAQMEHGGDLSAAAKALRETYEDNTIRLTERDAERLVEILDSPPAPTQALIDAARRLHREEVTPETEYAFLFGVS